MNIEDMKRRKEQLGYSNERLSELSGVPLGTLQKIFSGQTRSPRYDTLESIHKTLFGTADDVLVVAETAPVYQPECEADDIKEPDLPKTIADYLALPEDVRVELIDGKFYDMASPASIHQYFAGQIHHQLCSYVADKGGDCLPFISPMDVQLDCDDRTMVQPDVFVLCDRKKIKKNRITGAPDFVAEVVSPNYVVKDVLIKMNKYRNAGVREYWIIFPLEKMIMVYNFERSDLPDAYSFEDRVPVAIWGGQCQVDFSMICRDADFLYEAGE